ncbi:MULTISPECIES: hypothetical protein [Methylobacterium]|uniref:Uncharacterized protein n=1 Tax=Methylobacterium nonmethylotrophicum TaxID=1141884 RepID=A0A4Z0NN77_9HYPH|nr:MULTISPECIES: hypothetical protein [Methylobacterium]PIK72043.1 hypothetical protein CS379_16115 [Methylobacterium frigidaeris]TGD97914.1 hypothetical protein EU555_17240 [Methylobacterium nonmethylotrophicum]
MPSLRTREARCHPGSRGRATTASTRQAILDERIPNRRPFASIEEHDETLIANRNAAVGTDDTVRHLGDFCYRRGEDHAGSQLSVALREIKVPHCHNLEHTWPASKVGGHVRSLRG